MKMSKLSRNKRTEAKKRKISLQPYKTRQNKLRKLRKRVIKAPWDKQARQALTKIESGE